tara:strand:+ start:342 stop:806 length:465 start_codon:yes stop_codon:yes gene_type:complete
MGLVLHRHYGRVDLVNELLDKGDASLIDVSSGVSEHYMHSEGGHKADLMTLDHFTTHYLEEFNYIAIPQEDNTVEWVVCGLPKEKGQTSVQFKLVINEILKNDDYPNLSTDELQLLYMDRNRIERINPSVLGTAYQAAVQSLHNASGTRMQNVV